MRDEKNITFAERVNEKLYTLTKMGKKSALYMAANQQELIYASISTLAEEIGTSEATITRVSNRLGYNNFQELKVSVARELVRGGDRIHENLKPGATVTSMIASVFQTAISTLENTGERLNEDSVKEAIEAISKAEKLVVTGNGNSASVAQDTAHKFLRQGKYSHAYTDDHMQMIALSSCDKSDVVLVFSHSGSSRNAIDVIRLANEKGTRSILITNNGISPAAKMADIVLSTYSTETRYRINAISSRLAELAIVDVLYTGVALASMEETISSFEALEKALAVKKY